MTHHPGLLRTAPLQGETTSSLICRIASRHGVEAKDDLDDLPDDDTHPAAATGFGLYDAYEEADKW